MGFLRRESQKSDLVQALEDDWAGRPIERWDWKFLVGLLTRHQQGDSVSELAKNFNLPEWEVRAVIRRARQLSKIRKVSSIFRALPPGRL